MSGKSISLEDKNKMIQLYLSGMGATHSARMLGYSRSSCITELKKRSIPLRNEYVSHRKYFLNENFFDIIDTEDKAYWLGFLSADGCVINNTLYLYLSKIDEKHIEKFLKSIDSNHPVYERILEKNKKQNISYGVSIGSKKLVYDLKELGVIQRKSFIIKPCNCVPNELIHHYWRGIIDGDGCLSIENNPTEYESITWSISLVGSRFICEGFEKWVKSFTNGKASVRPKQNIFRIKFGGTPLVKSIVKELYRDSTIFLDRKYKLANEILNTFKLEKKLPNITKNELESMHKEFGSWELVRKKYGISKRSLNKIRRQIHEIKDL